jgi:hypothetical protein
MDTLKALEAANAIFNLPCSRDSFVTLKKNVCLLKNELKRFERYHTDASRNEYVPHGLDMHESLCTTIARRTGEMVESRRKWRMRA